MTPGNYTLVVPIGTHLSQQFVWEADGVGVDLTGWTGRLTVKRAPTDPAKLLEASTADGTLTLSSTGTIVVDIDVPAGLREAEVEWELVLTDPASKATRLLAGEAIITAGVPA